MLCFRKCIYLWHFPPRAEPSLVPVKSLYFLQIFSPKTNYLKKFFIILIFQLHPQLRLTRTCKILLCSAPYLSTTYSCIQNKSWAPVLSQGELCNDQSQKPLGMGEISTLILLKMNGGNEFDKLVFSSDNCSGSSWSPLDPLPPFFFVSGWERKPCFSSSSAGQAAALFLNSSQWIYATFHHYWTLLVI